MSSLTIRGIKKRFGPVEVLKGIDIELQSGEFLVLLGSSGCGKSTLLNIIAGLIDPSEGEILIGRRGWEPVGPQRLEVSAATRALEVRFAEAAEDVRAHVASHGAIVFHELEWSRYPHIVLREGELLWTSVHFALRRR